MNIENFIPKQLLEKIRKRSNRNEESRFPHKLWALLNWVNEKPERSEICGCGWFDDEIFFLNKDIICNILDIKLNTFNVNLKTLGFEQAKPRKSGITYWKNPSFTKNSNIEFLQQIRNPFNQNSEFSILKPKIRAVYLTLLEKLELYYLSNTEILCFKSYVINYWEIFFPNKFIFAVSYSLFCKVFEEKSIKQHDFYILRESLSLQTQDVVSIMDFAVLLSRFGPFDSIIFKIAQFQQILNDLRIDYGTFRYISSFFSPTYHNCFKFSYTVGEYHCYNLPLVHSRSEYLVDEDHNRFNSWQSALQNSNLLQISFF